ncbi:MAG: hypothetical protein L0Z50_19750 [Verrucomicrobiales bacterium]|nr:hypothetical protein [Verrucomicrobiales bacterium]
MTRIVQITAPHFCAGLMLRDGLVYFAAPMIAFMRGWSFAHVVDYATRNRWRVVLAE